MRKIISVILAVLMSMCLFTGCTLFEYDTERDYKQVAVKIDSVQIDGGTGVTPYTAPEKKIYKYDVVTYFNQVAATLVNDNGYTVSDAVDYCVDQLVVRELILNEAEAQLSFGNIVWSTHDENQVKQSVYTYIDSQLAALRNEILSERGYPTAEQTETTSTTTAETTYPVKEEEEVGLYDGWTRAMVLDAVNERTKGELTGDALDDLYNKNANYSTEKLITILENLDLAAEPAWAPDTLRYPGLYGTDDVKSLELEAMRRFMAYLEDSIENDYRLSEKERKTYLDDIKRLNGVGDEKGLPYIYPELGSAPVMNYLVGDGYRDSVKIQLLQSYVTNGVDVTDAEVKANYDALLSEQQQKYASASAFDTDITGGEVDHLVYYPNGNYYYVKHILVPFSDEQTAELTEYKAGLGTLTGDEAIAAKKEALGRAVTGFEHRNGENYGKPLTIQQIYADIETEMAKVKGNLRESAAKFDDLIYKYNTDDGIFGNDLGYVVKVTEGDEYDTTYMEEFSKAAKALYEQGTVGAISQPVATDYGVHILYLSKLIPASGLTVGLYDYVSDSSSETMFEHLREERLASKTNQVFSVWQNEKVGNYQTVKKVITRYEDVYSDLKEAE